MSEKKASSNFLRIKDLPEAGRPRERMLAQGAEALSEAELIAVLLGTGDTSRSAVGLAQHLLHTFAEPEESTGLRGLAATSAEELCEISGMGPAKASRLLAALELGRRMAEVGAGDRATIGGPKDAYRLLAPRLRGLDREHFVALLLNSKNQVLAIELVGIGSLNATLVHPRELFKEAVRKSAAAVLLAHNHPSGDPTPSPEDRALTQQLMGGGEILGIRIVDHLIIGDGHYVSLREASSLWVENSFHQ